MNTRTVNCVKKVHNVLFSYQSVALSSFLSLLLCICKWYWMVIKVLMLLLRCSKRFFAQNFAGDSIVARVVFTVFGTTLCIPKIFWLVARVSLCAC